MAKIKQYNRLKTIRISDRCYKAWTYLAKHKVTVSNIFRDGGEIAVINKANEFYIKEKKEKEFPGHPSWLFE